MEFDAMRPAAMRILRWISPLVIGVLLSCNAFAEDGGSSAPELHDGKTWTFSAGLGSSKGWNLVGITRELFLDDCASVFVTAGLGEMILGAGIAFYGNREGSGVVASAVAGTGLQLNLTYRWKLERSGYLALGGSYIRVFGFSDVEHPQAVPVLAYEHRF